VRSVLFVAAALAGIGPAIGDDIDLMVGLRHVMALAIRDYGYECPEVLDYEALEFIDGGRVLKVACRGKGLPARTELLFKLVAYPEGDFTVRRWSGSVGGPE
jgi:hypothetical protein